MNSYFLRCMQGMGDAVYTHAIVKALVASGAAVTMTCSWPQLYHDLPVGMVRPDTDLRTQADNVTRWPGRWVAPTGRRVSLGYNISHFNQGTCIPRALLASTSLLPNTQLDFSIEPSESAKSSLESLEAFPDGRPIGIIRPCTTRAEWYNAARPCRQEYLQYVIDTFPDVYWIEIGWISAGQEELFGPPLRGVSRSYLLGELSFDQLLATWWVADIAVSPVGFALPLGLALGTPTCILYGGDVPENLLLDRDHDLTKYRSVKPDPFCACYQKRHSDDQCNKNLDELEIKRAVEVLLAG